MVGKLEIYKLHAFLIDKLEGESSKNEGEVLWECKDKVFHVLPHIIAASAIMSL